MSSGFRMMRLTRKNLEKLADEGRTTDIDLIGMVFVDDDVSPDLIESTVRTATINGRVLGTPEARKALLARCATGA